MTVARVVGNIWGTKKHPALNQSKLLLVQNMDVESGKVYGEVALAVDKSFDAGPGDTVLLMDEGGSARHILKDKTAPVRLIVCGIVDLVTVKEKTSKYH